MATLVALVLLASVLFPAGFSAVDPICAPSSSNPDDPAPPQLPNQYYLAIEAVLVERNHSVFATEHFDGVGNRGRLDFTGRGRKISSVLDYNLREAFVYPNPRTGDACTVSILTTNTTNREVEFIFGIQPGPNNTVHIGSPSLFFGLGSNLSNATYMGIEPLVARGVSTYHWKTCMNSENASFSLDYYFTNSELWNTTYPDSGDYVPVLVILYGSLISRSTGEEYTTLHHYNFIDFQSGPQSVPDEVFDIPLDLVCKGRLPGQPLPQFPDVFSANVELVNSGNVSTYKEYYDYTHQLFRVDGYLSLNDFTGVFVLIHDFSIGAQYFLEPNNNFCGIQNLNRNNTLFDSTVDSKGQIHLESVRTLFLTNSEYQFVYEGITTVRGIPVDVWISYRSQETLYSFNFTDVVYTLFITRPGQVSKSEFGFTTDPVIVQTKFAAVLTITFPNGTTNVTNISSTSNLFGFTPSEPPLDVYSTLACLSPSDYEVVRFRVPLTTAPPNQDKFRSNIRSAFIKYAKGIGMPFVSPLQINSIMIDTRRIPNAVFVMLYVTNIPQNASVTWRYSAQAFVSNLTAGLSNNSRLPFTIRFNGTSGVDEVYPLYITTPSTVAPDCSGEAPIAVAAGISVGVLFVGIVVGLVAGLAICFCFQRYKNTGTFSPPQELSSSKYERQINN